MEYLILVLLMPFPYDALQTAAIHPKKIGPVLLPQCGQHTDPSL